MTRISKNPKRNFITRCESVGQNQLRVNILEDGLTYRGHYIRHYPNLYRTFCPFTFRGNTYALYSPNKRGTRVLKIDNTIQDIGGELESPHDSYPSDYFVYTTTESVYAFCLAHHDSAHYNNVFNENPHLDYLQFTCLEKGEFTRKTIINRMPTKITLESCFPYPPTHLGNQTFFRILSEQEFQF